MPSEPIPGLQWLVPKLLKDLTESKMWPIKLTGVKHQDTLRDFQALNYKIIKLYINTYVYKSNINHSLHLKPHPTPCTSYYPRRHPGGAIQSFGGMLLPFEALVGQLHSGLTSL